METATTWWLGSWAAADKPNSITAAKERYINIVCCVLIPATSLTLRVGQVVNLRPIGNRPVNNSEFNNGPINNRPQDAILPYKNCQMDQPAAWNAALSFL